MSIKKFAMMLLVAGVIYVLSGNVAYASEAANTISENSEITEIADEQAVLENDEDTTVEEEKKDDVDNIKDSVVVKGKKTKKKYSKADLRLMASIINCEAGGESFQGQVAVGIVVMNRVKAKNFPNTIRKVIYQPYQFSPVRNGMLNKKLQQYDHGKIKSAQWKSCIKAAKKALDGQSYVVKAGKKRSMSGIKFFSVGLAGAKFRLGGHKFK